MKLHLESNIAEGTPEELAEYLRLLGGKNKDNQLFCYGHAHQPDEDALTSLLGSLKGADSYTDSTEISTDEEEEPKEEADGLLGYRYWYLEGTTFNKFVVLEATTYGYLEDSRGKRYTYQAVSGYAKPVDREDAYVHFDDAEQEGSLLKYYPTLDMFDEE